MEVHEIRTWKDLMTEDVAGRVETMLKLRVHITPGEVLWGAGWEVFTLAAVATGYGIPAVAGTVMILAGAVEVQRRVMLQKVERSNIRMYDKWDLKSE